VSGYHAGFCRDLVGEFAAGGHMRHRRRILGRDGTPIARRARGRAAQLCRHCQHRGKLSDARQGFEPTDRQPTGRPRSALPWAARRVPFDQSFLSDFHKTQSLLTLSVAGRLIRAAGRLRSAVADARPLRESLVDSVVYGVCRGADANDWFRQLVGHQLARCIPSLEPITSPGWSRLRGTRNLVVG
jgi:hypothetical protein